MAVRYAALCPRWRDVTLDNGTDGQRDRRADRQTDGRTDRVRRIMRPPPSEEGRIKNEEGQYAHYAPNKNAPVDM